MAMLTAYFGLNVTLNYSWSHISMLKGSLVEKNSKFFIKNKTYPVAWNQKKCQKLLFLQIFVFRIKRAFCCKNQTSYLPLLIKEVKNWKMVTGTMFLAEKFEK